jgi:hypothetical protein
VSTNTFPTSLYLAINGNECEVDCDVHYEYEPAGGDGWNEPRYGERATLCAVYVGAFDLLPLLTKECISALEADCCQHEADEREVRASEYAEWKRETQWEVL